MKTIPLTKGYVALVDDKDYERLSKHNWCVTIKNKRTGNQCVYVQRTIGEVDGTRKTIAMHTEILGALGGDHIDRNGLNNQRYNLRAATHSQNNANRGKIARNASSDFVGVHLHKPTGKWVAQIRINGKKKHLGQCKEEVDAAMIYNLAALEEFGEFAHFNTPMEGR